MTGNLGGTMIKILSKMILKISAPIYNRFYRKNNKQQDITFLSNNCIGGVLYHMLGLPFSSPTINMFIEDECFVKLAEDPRHYFSIDAQPYEENHIDYVGEDLLTYPIIKVDDILLCCQHYKSCSEAVDAWNRRRHRVNFDKLYVICCTWNLHEREDLVERISKIPYPSVIFTTKDFKYKNCLKLNQAFYKEDIRGVIRPNLTSFKGVIGKRYFVDEFDFIQWINT